MSNKKETWKPITIDGRKPTVPYVISNHGRFGVLYDGKVQVRSFKPTAGNYRYNTRQKGRNRAIFLYKEVAKAFLKKPSVKHNFIIHLDHDYLNDNVSNLKWATHQEHRAHTSGSPRSVIARQRRAITKSTHSKILDEKKVTLLKKMIWDPKRKLSYKQLAAKFGVSEMQIYRIKTGEFWFHIRVENEPLHAKYKQNLNNIAYQNKKTAEEKKALDIIAARQKRAKALQSARYQKLKEMARVRKVSLEREKKVFIKRKTSKKTATNAYRVIKLASKQKK